MTPEQTARDLEATVPVLQHILLAFDHVDRSWKPGPRKWSALEILGHLADEEELDFRVRIEHTLEDPEKPWPAIDPEGWVTERDYAGQDFDEHLARWLRAREDSVRWLRKLGPVDRVAAYAHPSAGKISVGELLTAWAAHDVLHLRQLTELRFRSLEHRARPYSTRYAGAWPAGS